MGDRAIRGPGRPFRAPAIGNKFSLNLQRLAPALTDTLHLPLPLILSVSLLFNGHFPGGPGLASTKLSPFWTLLELRMMDCSQW